MTIATKIFPRKSVTNYDVFRPEIKSGDLLLCSGTGFFSRMIQTATKSIWSHVAFVVRLDAINRIMILESVEDIGVRTVPLRKYLHDYDSRGNSYPGRIAIARHANFADKAKPEKLYKFGQFAVDLFGYPYDNDEIVKIAARIAGSYMPFSKNVRKTLKPDQEYICSEYVLECYRQLGINITHDSRGFIAPADFAKSKEVTLLAVLK